MKHLSRPYLTSYLSLVALAGIGWALAVSPARGAAQAQQLTPVFQDANTQAASTAQGYLGVDIADVETGKVQALKLKDTHGALITLIDHDAPAGQIGLRVNDVVLQLDGQSIESADQLRRLLKDLPAGSKITLQISRDGNLQAFTVVLVNRKRMEQSVWHKLGTTSSGVPEMGLLSGDSMPSGFHLPSFGSTLKVGALVEPLTTQMAAYLGVESGLMVKQVAHKSEAEKAGLRAFDVIIKIGSDSIATSADWDRALRSNQGKPVQVTILRDKKQQTLILQVDSKHEKGALDRKKKQQVFGPGDQELMAALNSGIDGQLAEEISAQADAAAQTARAQAEVDSKQMQELRQVMEQFRQEMEEWGALVDGRFV